MTINKCEVGDISRLAGDGGRDANPTRNDGSVTWQFDELEDRRRPSRTWPNDDAQRRSRRRRYAQSFRRLVARPTRAAATAGRTEGDPEGSVRWLPKGQ